MHVWLHACMSIYSLLIRLQIVSNLIDCNKMHLLNLVFYHHKFKTPQPLTPFPCCCCCFGAFEKSCNGTTEWSLTAPPSTPTPQSCPPKKKNHCHHGCWPQALDTNSPCDLVYSALRCNNKLLMPFHLPSPSPVVTLGTTPCPRKILATICVGPAHATLFEWKFKHACGHGWFIRTI
jgi:hypothetical protein